MRKSLLFGFVMVIVLPVLGWAEEDVDKRIEKLEERQAELYHSLEEKKEAGVGQKITENISIGGLIEVEAGFGEVMDEDESDIALATVEVGLDAEINDKVSGHILLLYEDDGADFTVDEGYITLTAPYGLSLTAGRMYIPFGVFNSHFISDPLTLELGETQEAALLLTYGTEAFEVSFGVFNGDVRETGDDDEIDDIVASLTVTPSEGITFGVSYISDIYDTDADITGEAEGTGLVSDIVAGYSAFFSGSFGAISVEAEYLAAADDDLDLDGDGSGDEPSTYNLEVAYTVSEALEVAVRIAGSDDLAELPEDLIGVALSYGIYESTTLAFEYQTGEFDNDTDYSMFTAQLAIEF